jgi:nicotinate-nucleotide adenylyltransferase
VTIGVFGGSFDPPHCGHVLLAAYALSAAPIDRLLVVPAYAHPFGKRSADFEERVVMCERAFGLLRGAEVSRIESELGGASYTVRTLEELVRRHPGEPLRLLVGADVLPDLHRWRDIERVRELAPLFVVGRTGHARADGMETPDLPAVSSTEIRARLSRGESVAGLVPRAVAEHCAARGLYRA